MFATPFLKPMPLQFVMDGRLDIRSKLRPFERLSCRPRENPKDGKNDDEFNASDDPREGKQEQCRFAPSAHSVPGRFIPCAQLFHQEKITCTDAHCNNGNCYPYTSADIATAR